MVSSKAATPEDYIAELPAERRALVSRIRDLVNANLPDGYVERMNWGMISWEVPLDRYPATYNGQPLGYASLAAQKNHTALYLNCVYASAERTERLKQAWVAAGKKLDMGKSCLRFKGEDQLAEDVLADTIRAIPVDAFIADYEAGRAK
ncbi:MAG TPA: DUF1801 domain-containing protein [Allosphingosinicella sp.]|uniref:DUF1801 domain-containing protein n=1 Tax=Allosphingosinicella sp. TaxID=2823234 RepID=UPI002F28D2B2